jgi:geranylgeranyl diphosphate synthase type II
MIEYKTVLVAAAMKIDYIIAQSSKDNAKLIYDFGLNLGLFSVQDDCLDAFGDPKILVNKWVEILSRTKKLFMPKSNGVLRP